MNFCASYCEKISNKQKSTDQYGLVNPKTEVEKHYSDIDQNIKSLNNDYSDFKTEVEKHYSVRFRNIKSLNNHYSDFKTELEKRYSDISE